MYASDVGRRLVGSFPLPVREQLGVFFVEPDELDQVFDAKVGERLNTIFADAIDPDQAVLDLHFDGNVAQPVFVFTEVLCDLGDGGDRSSGERWCRRPSPEATAINEERTNRGTIITDLIDGQSSDPARVIAFNTAEGWSRDVSHELADESAQRCSAAAWIASICRHRSEVLLSGMPANGCNNFHRRCERLWLYELIAFGHCCTSLRCVCCR
jgi:hypothetical protein